MRRVSALCGSLVIGVAMLTAPASAAEQPAVELIPDGHVRAAWHDDVLRLDGGAGWVRTRRLFSDFVVEFEMRLLKVETRVRVGFRSWPGYTADGSPGYQVLLSESPSGKPSSTIEARRLSVKATTLDRPALEPHAAGDWHKVRLVVDHTNAAVYVDGQLTAAAEGLNEFTGYFTLSGSEGASEFRHIGVALLDAAPEAFGAGAHHMTEPGLQAPRLIHEVKPFYPQEAHDRRTQGAVLVETVILEDGSPGQTRVIRSVEPDLDEAAVAAVRKWHFRPGRKDGAPVRVVVTIEMTFSLGTGSPR